MGKDRLLVAADGTLHAIPFGALPWPPSSPLAGRLLAETHTLVSIPGASAAYWLHRMPVHTARLRLLTVADPVFDRSDGRLLHPSPSTTAMRAARSVADLEEMPLRRLAHAGREADAILKRVAPGERRDVRGFEASRDFVLGGGLAGAAIVHFATHGFFDPRRPELSGIALSRFDRAGHRRRGYVTTQDLQMLRLSADLVVLSACQTALGRKVPGEGPLGLSYALFQAGARTLVVSLWKVDDAATAELMERFYQRMLGEGAAPAQALRDAQLAIRQQKRWRKPYYWAGFLVEGDGFSPLGAARR